MMFLEFFVWGGWFVTLGSYLASTLHASGAQTALAYSTQSWGAIIAPFIVGLIAVPFTSQAACCCTRCSARGTSRPSIPACSRT